MIAELAWIAEIGDLPAIQVVLGHAFLGETLEFIGVAGGLRAEQAVASDFLGLAAVVDFVKLMPAAELARQTVPQQLEQLDAFLGLVAARNESARYPWFRSLLILLLGNAFALCTAATETNPERAYHGDP